MRTRNKKAQGIYVGLLVGFYIVIMVSLYFTLQEKYSAKTLGEKPLSLIKSYQAGEQVNVYIEESARLASKDTILQIGSSGGFYDSPDCGDYYGFNMWHDEADSCYPKGNDISYSYSSFFSDDLQEYLESFGNFSDFYVSLADNRITGVFVSYELSKGAKFGAPEVAVSTATPTVNPTVDYKIPPNDATKQALQKISADYGAIIRQASQQYGVSESLIIAHIMLESAGNTLAVGQTSDVGISQFSYPTAKSMPEYFTKLTRCCEQTRCVAGEIKKCTPANDDRFDAAKSIFAEANLISLNLKIFAKYSSKEEFTIAAYNSGPTNVKKAIAATGKSDPSWQEVSAVFTPASVVNYVEKVTRYKYAYQSAVGASS